MTTHPVGKFANKLSASVYILVIVLTAGGFLYGIMTRQWVLAAGTLYGLVATTIMLVRFRRRLSVPQRETAPPSN